MTRKHFILLASILKRYNQCETTKSNLLAKQGLQELTEDISAICESENPQFDREKFLKACGIE